MLICTTTPAVLREVSVTAPSWIYSVAERAADGAPSNFRIKVAQVSERFGPGPFGEIEING